MTRLDLRGSTFKYNNDSDSPVGVVLPGLARAMVASPLVDLYTILFLAASEGSREGLLFAYHSSFIEGVTHCTVPKKRPTVLVNWGPKERWF